MILDSIAVDHLWFEIGMGIAVGIGFLTYRFPIPISIPTIINYRLISETGDKIHNLKPQTALTPRIMEIGIC